MTKVIYTPDSSGAFCGFLISFLRRIISKLGRTEFMGHLTKVTKSSIMTKN